MRYLLKSAVALLLLWILLIGVARLVGQIRPLPAPLAHLAECVIPCWMSIILGTTPTDKAIQYLQAAFAIDIRLPPNMSIDKSYDAREIAFSIPINSEPPRDYLSGYYLLKGFFGK
jgi:hypothetical protein